MLLLTPSSSEAPDTRAHDWHWVTSSDGVNVEHQGTAPLSSLPPAKECCLVVPTDRLSWHQVTLPKVSNSRWRAALTGALEDRLLEPPESLHLALPPSPATQHGQPIWVAACQAAWLQQQLDLLTQAGFTATRLLPETCPTAEWHGLAHERGNTHWLTLSGPAGVLNLPLNTPPHGASGWSWPPQAVCHSTPACLSTVDPLWPGQTWLVTTRAQHWLHQAATGWDLAQFDFKRSTAARQQQRWREQWRRLRHAPEWRPLRWGLLAGVVVQTIGLNVAAWQEQQWIQTLQARTRQTLTDTFPHIGVVLDAPRQMQQALNQLQLQQGQPDTNGLEPLLQSLASTPEAPLPPLVAIDYRPTEVTLTWDRPVTAPPQHPTLHRQGWQVQPLSPTQWHLTRTGSNAP